MKSSYILKTLIILFLASTATMISFFFTHAIYKQIILSRAPEFSFTKISKATIQPMYASPIYLEIQIQDDYSTGNNIILEVEFNHEPIFLKPPDANGDRALIHMQIRPGKYTIRWKIENDKISWPRINTYEKKITIEKTSLWKHILIKGNKIQVS